MAIVNEGVKTDFRKTVRRRSWKVMLLLLAVTGLLLLASTLSHLRFDWTEDKVYTLSESTVSVLDQLEEPILVRAYITSGLPQPYGRLTRFLEDILQSYHEAGAGNFSFEIVDPSRDPNVSASLKAMNIPKVQVQVVEDDQAQVKQGYLAVVIEYLDAKETIPVIQGEEGFEYLLTRKIKKITGKGRIKLGISPEFGASGLDMLRRFKNFAREDYELVEVDLEKDKIPADIRTLIIAGIDKAPTKAFRYRLDQFRMRGGALLVLAGNVKAMLSTGFEVQPIDSVATDWIRDDLGVAIEPGLVMDKRATRVGVNQQRGGVIFRSLVDYPFLPSVSDFDREHIVTAGLEGVSIPFASPLLWVNDEGKGQYVLMRSSEESAIQSGPPFDVNPLISMESRFSGMMLRPSSLALAWDSPVDSAFDKPPAGVSDGVHIRHTDSSRGIVLGSASFLDDEFMNGGNLVAVLNMIDWLSGDEALIKLRSRGVTERPLQTLSPAGRSFFKLLWMFALPIMIALLGLWRWRVLKQRKAIQAG